ncbi:MAG TPA: MBL fold metallo-hydrolase [Aestuariivirgaceae bacterium]|nr:MBL fold metallo-hydrolase [Aestuariivirgaceae bacterium]
MMLNLSFHGAARTVTGSCYLLETGAHRLLIDCGMFQGSKTESALNYRAFPVEQSSVDAMLLTHAHIDHCGLIPKLVKHGFRNRIHATEATVDLCSIMLPDSGHVQETEVRQLNARNARRGRPLVEPIYGVAEAEAAMNQFAAIGYRTWFEPVPGVRARCWNAGHLLGSASIEVEVAATGGRAPLRILFSGDIGPAFKLLEPDPEAPSGFDYVLCESTYGAIDRPEATDADRRRHLASEVTAAARRGGVLLIPSFAVERTQELMTDLTTLIDQGLVPPMMIFIDSPLAYRATRFFTKYASALDNGDVLLKALKSAHVRLTENVDDSKALNRLAGFHVIIAASGMCDAGRIRHHLRNRLSKPNTTVLLASFQAVGTLGRVLADGADRVRIFGEDIAVRAHIGRIDDYSGHADAPELHAWLKARLPVNRGVFLVHGEDPGMDGLTRRIADLIPADRIFRPALDDGLDLLGAKPALVPAEPRRRLPPSAVGHSDWHNELAKLILDINDEIAQAADEKARGMILRRLRRALQGAEPQTIGNGRI